MSGVNLSSATLIERWDTWVLVNIGSQSFSLIEQVDVRKMGLGLLRKKNATASQVDEEAEGRGKARRIPGGVRASLARRSSGASGRGASPPPAGQ